MATAVALNAWKHSTSEEKTRSQALKQQLIETEFKLNKTIKDTDPKVDVMTKKSIHDKSKGEKAYR